MLRALRAVVNSLMILVMLVACAEQGQNPVVGSTNVEQPLAQYVPGEQTLSDKYPSQTTKPGHGFVKHQYYLGKGGRQLTLTEVADALERDPLRIFRGQKAVEVFTWAVKVYRPDVSSLADLAKILRDPSQARTTACVGTIDTMAYDAQGAIKWIQRPCYRGELLVEVKVGDSWVAIFSLACLNPLDAPIPVQRVGQTPSSPCTVWHPFPTGPARGGNVIVFLTDAEAECVEPEQRCIHRSCTPWMRGIRNGPNKAPAALRGKDAAYIIKDGVAGIWGKPGHSPWWCDLRTFGPYEARALKSGMYPK